MSNIDLVSIIIPVYDRVDAFRKALKSALVQTYRATEIIVVDDGSNEDIAAVMSITGDKKVQLVRQENSGPGIARRNGLKASNGKYIQYLDSDDEILPEKIEKQVELFEKNEDSVLCYTPTIQIGPRGQQTIRKLSDQPSEDLLATALQWRRWHTSSCLWRYPDKKVPFWAHHYNGEDIVHDVSIGVHYRGVCFLPETLTIAHQDGSGISVRPADPQKLERYKTGIVESLLMCLDMLKKMHLDNMPCYANPLAERLYHSGLLLAKYGDLKKSLHLLANAKALSKNNKKRLEIDVAYSIVFATRSKLSNAYSLLFRLHRKLVRPEIHVYRSV